MMQTQCFQTYLLSILLLFVTISTSSDIDDLAEFYNSLKNSYVPYIRPVHNQSLPLTVSIHLVLHSVVSYEERNGALSSVVIMNMFWTDELLKTLYPRKFNMDIPIPVSLVWSPTIRVYNSITEDTTLRTGDTKFQTILLNPNGTMHYGFMGLTMTKCEANIFYYPMDQQKCKILFIADEPFQKVAIEPLFLESSDLNLTTTLIKNEEWEIRNVTFKSHIFYPHSGLTFSFTMSRRPLYLMMNFVVPLAYLCLLNSLVFLLPESSGERMSYAVTMLLCLILYLNMIADRLPSTVPISLLNIYIVIQLNSSCFIVLMTILTLWMYDNQQRNQPVTEFWQAFLRFVDPKCSKRSKMDFHAEKSEVEEVDDKTGENYKIQTEHEKESHVTWFKVSRSANRCLFCVTFVFFTTQVLVFLIFLIVSYTSY